MAAQPPKLDIKNAAADLGQATAELIRVATDFGRAAAKLELAATELGQGGNVSAQAQRQVHHEADVLSGRIDQRLDEIDKNLEQMAREMQARDYNNAVRQGNSTMTILSFPWRAVPISIRTGKEIPDFPRTPEGLLALSDEEVDVILDHLGHLMPGVPSTDKTNRLWLLLGMKHMF